MRHAGSLESTAKLPVGGTKSCRARTNLSVPAVGAFWESKRATADSGTRASTLKICKWLTAVSIVPLLQLKRSRDL
jgi:hypothetical protein